MLCAVGDALITFNYEQHAVNCIRDHRSGWLQRVLAFVPCVHQGRKSAPKLNANTIAVVRWVLRLELSISINALGSASFSKSSICAQHD